MSAHNYLTETTEVKVQLSSVELTGSVILVNPHKVHPTLVIIHVEMEDGQIKVYKAQDKNDMAGLEIVM